MPSKKYVFITTTWMGTGTVDGKKKGSQYEFRPGN